jgi:predicted RNase H-like HicB family nuclease
MQLDYIAWKDEGQWSAHSPSVPGVYGLGETRQEAISDLIEGVGEMLDYLDEIGADRPAKKRLVSGVIEVR